MLMHDAGLLLMKPARHEKSMKLRRGALQLTVLAD
jgi:hypothetical protein